MGSDVWEKFPNNTVNLFLSATLIQSFNQFVSGQDGAERRRRGEFFVLIHTNLKSWRRNSGVIPNIGRKVKVKVL